LALDYCVRKFNIKSRDLISICPEISDIFHLIPSLLLEIIAAIPEEQLSIIGTSVIALDLLANNDMNLISVVMRNERV
jgi:hypothetical protein